MKRWLKVLLALAAAVVAVATGAVVALLCNVLCFLPGTLGVIPLNAVTPLIGAPVIIYVILRGRQTSNR